MSLIRAPFRWLTSTSFARSLRVRLVLLVLLASLPSFLMLSVTAAQQRADALSVGQEATQRLARLAASNQSNVSGQIELVLSTLAVLPPIQGNDRTECTNALRGISNTDPEEIALGGRNLRVDGASFERIAVVNANGSTFCTGATGGGSISSVDAAMARITITSGQITRGNIRSDRNGSMIVTYVVPTNRQDGEGRRAIIASLNIYALRSFAHEAKLASGSQIFVFDDEGVIEQQYPHLEKGNIGISLAGTPAIDRALGQMATGDDASANRQQPTIDGVAQVIGYDSYWISGADGTLRLTHTMVATPKSAIVERANEKFNQNLGKLAIAGIMALIAAWVGADLFTGRDGETRKSIVRDLYHTFATGNVQTLEQFIGPGYTDRNPLPGQAAGIDGLRQTISAFRGAFPDGKITVRDLWADSDMVIARVSLSGTHQGEYFGITPTGCQVSAEGVESFRFANGMIVESWSMFGPLNVRNEAATVLAAVPSAEPPGWLRRLFRRSRTPVGSDK